MQNNWIGRSEGAELRFSSTNDDGRNITVFTTRPDTLYGASFIALSPQHPMATELALTYPELGDFIAECAQLGTSEAVIEKAEKKGFNTGLFVDHPLIKGHKLPVYIANFVLMDYGTGAIFGCPAHDQRDLILPINITCQLFRWCAHVMRGMIAVLRTAFTGPGVLFNSGEWNWAGC